MPRALFLCSGTGSVGKPFREAGYEVVDVDRDGRFGAEVVVDLHVWDYKAAYPQGHFDVVWASPDCTQYSQARRSAKTPRDLVGADRLVAKCREIIEYYQPRLWFIENPDTGLLKTRDVVAGLPFVRVDYCMYGAPYRKRTRIWTNVQWTPQLCDKSHLINGRHARVAQRGPVPDPSRRHLGCTLDELHALPQRLCAEICALCDAREQPEV